jgi:peroxiredoxin
MPHLDPANPLAPGERAPDFSLPTVPGESASLSDFRGRPVILVFYPADWSPDCGDQLTLYNEVLPEFERLNAVLLAISVDNVWSHAAYGQSRRLRFPLLSDFEPKGAVARRYRVFREEDGMNERALFVIDAEGVIRWSYLAPRNINPGADGVLAALESLGTATPEA